MAKNIWLNKINSKKILLVILLVASFLRLFKLSVNPPSLFGDELDLGYHAYSIAKTGRDYQGNLMPLHFHSLAEWRTPLYLYSAVPTVAVFGVTPLGVRLPAAFFGILTVGAMYFLTRRMFDSEKIGLFAAGLLAISPWHLHYSRAGFEVTELLFFLIFGLLMFLKSLDENKWLWLSVVFLVLTPLIYSTAKMFTPFLMLCLFVLYRDRIFKFEKKELKKAIIAGLILGAPIVWSTLFGGGATRFNYISVFSDPTIESEVGFARGIDAGVRGETGLALTPKFLDRVIHNKFTFVGERIVKNYFQSFSTEFLFMKGDPDPRHSIGIGELYRIEVVMLLAGIIFLFTSKKVSQKVKLFIFLWIMLAPVPAAITRDGGNHATRLIVALPTYIFLIAFGLNTVFEKLSGNYLKLATAGIAGLYALSLFFYIHEYYVHYPWYSQRWWHAGWGEAISSVKEIDTDYDRVIISMSGEPAWIFFAGHYQYDPSKWQSEFPIGRDEEVPGFGKISHTGKFYFGTPDKDIQIYGLSRVIDSKTLYLANANEVGENLILNPDKGPSGLKLIKSIPFPSGEPAFYLFSGTEDNK
jgi:4-amino-4-deoxy-L-arabinose transferase-like glycosyltransferase